MYVSPQTDQLPHEPSRVRWSTVPFLARLLAKGLAVSLLALLTAGLWPLFLLGVAVWGWPPHQPRPARFRQLLGLTWTARPPEPGIAPLSRVWICMQILQVLALVPVRGLAWYLDEVLYGRTMEQQAIVAPLILLSAARSGSTQISHYLEEDLRLAAPTVLQIFFPYLWLWRIVYPLFARHLSPARAKELLDAISSEEFVQRHEGHPYRTDTFEILYGAQRLFLLTPMFGPRALIEDFNLAGSAPHNRQIWGVDFVDFIDRLGRKTLIFAGPGEDGQPRRLFFKGHFLDSGDALAARYPDAHFLTVIREPVSRLRSRLNHTHGNNFAEPLGAVPWAWLAAALPEAEVSYSQLEMDWFTRAEGTARTVIRFTEYVADLEGTMRLVYRRCMGDEQLPPHVPTAHAPRERKQYRVNRSLDDLGIDREAFVARLADYLAWCR